MSFYPTYYITLCCPTLQRSLHMIDQYVERGAISLQVDMPSRFPIHETDFVKSQMQMALEKCDDYSIYMNAFQTIHKKHPTIHLHIVVYPDVIESIGREAFVQFYFDAKLSSVMIAGGCDELTHFLKGNDITVIGRIDRSLDAAQLAQLALLSLQEPDNIFNFNFKRHASIQPHGCCSLKEKFAYIRNAGVRVKIWAVEGISSPDMMAEVKAAGADGALVGNVLMSLWHDNDKLWSLFNSFQALTDLP